MNVTSTTDLFTYAKKQNSLHSNSSSVAHPISPSNRPRGSLTATIDHDSKMQIQISPNTMPIKNIRNIDTKDQIKLKSRDLHPSSDEYNNPLQHIRSTYNDLLVKMLCLIKYLYFRSESTSGDRSFYASQISSSHPLTREILTSIHLSLIPGQQ